MALTVLLALTGALILTFTFIPAGVALMLRGRVAERESPVVRGIKYAYAPALDAALRFRWPIVARAAQPVVAYPAPLRRMGKEFIPSLDEGDIAMHAMRIPSTSLSQAIDMQHQLEERIQSVPEVERVFAKIGTAEIATDPMPPAVADVFLILKPRADWPDPRKPKAQLVSEIEELVQSVPGNNYEFTQPIQMRFNELISGVRSDLAVKVYGDDLDTLVALGERVETLLAGVQGASDIKTEQITGLPFLSITPKREHLARYGIPIAELQRVVRIALGGEKAGTLFEGDRRFSIVVRMDDAERADPAVLARLPVPLTKHEGEAATPGPEFVPLGELAAIEVTIGPNQISRENGKRRAVVTANVRGRDLGSVVSEAKTAIEREIQLPPGYWLDYGGTFEQLESATQRLSIVV